MPPHSRPTDSRGSFSLPVTPPYRLDLTAAALRRTAGNPTDVEDAAGVVRAFAVDGRTVVVRVAQPSADLLDVRVSDDRVAPCATIAALVRRTYGCDRDPQAFVRRAAAIDWLAPLAARLRGVRPPRYPTLWEACVNAIVFQQISIAAATAISARVVRAYGERLAVDASHVYAFPSPDRIARASVTDLRACGMSAGKTLALQSVAVAIREGAIDEAEIARLPSADAAARLCRLRGIGPWSAAVVLLRGFGRLDVFPLADSGVARSVRLLAGAEIDVPSVLDVLGDERGMLYYHLLLARRIRNGSLMDEHTAVSREPPREV